MPRPAQAGPRPSLWQPKDATRFYGKHTGETIFVVGYGHSLKDFDWSRLDGRVTIALNNAVRHFTPTYWMFVDQQVWHMNRNMNPPKDMPIIIPDRMKAVNFPWREQAHGIRYGSEFSPVKNELWIRGTVACAGLGLAYHLGAKRIALMGIDCCTLVGKHYYADGAKPAYNTTDAQLSPRVGKRISTEIIIERRHDVWIEALSEMHGIFKAHKCYDKGLEIYNCSEISYLKAFPKKTFDEIIGEEAE